MFYKSKIEGVVRVSPERFKEELKVAVMQQLKKDLEGSVTETLGRIIIILDVSNIGEGVIIPGDGAAFYRTTFEAVHFVPEVNELIEGEIRDIAKFGAFIDFGPFEGMVHISQTMDDFVSVTKQGTLQGKDSKKVLKVGDKVRARIVAVSFKDLQNPKLGLTMRQQYLGKLEWIDELRKKEATVAKNAVKATESKAKKK